MSQFSQLCMGRSPWVDDLFHHACSSARHPTVLNATTGSLEGQSNGTVSRMLVAVCHNASPLPQAPVTYCYVLQNTNKRKNEYDNARSTAEAISVFRLILSLQQCIEFCCARSFVSRTCYCCIPLQYVDGGHVIAYRQKFVLHTAIC